MQDPKLTDIARKLPSDDAAESRKRLLSVAEPLTYLSPSQGEIKWGLRFVPFYLGILRWLTIR
jgi:hypothetical protein